MSSLSTAAPAVALKYVRFAYRAGRDVLDIPALSIARGEHVFLHGPSGSGKTTLLGLLAGVLIPTAGRVEILGSDLGAMKSGARDHLFSLEADPTLRIMGNRNEIYSAISNLVFNAVHYTPTRGVIQLRWYRDDTGAHLEVQDNGIGIDDEHVERITERFYRVDPSRSRSDGGTGLGLAIVKHVLMRHDATLNIRSALGEGSTFRCDFPPEAIVKEDVAPALTQRRDGAA